MKFSQIKTNCSYCDKEISLKKSQFERANLHFCNVECKHNYNRQNGFWGKQPHNYQGDKEVICVNCGKDFTVGSYQLKISITSDNSTYAHSAVSSVLVKKKQFVSLTREADGTVNFYIGDKNTAPALSGSADQDSGSPVSGTTSVYLGNNAAGARTFDGLIPELEVVEGILTLAQITQYWSHTGSKY